MVDTVITDDRVLELRSRGRSYGAIAKTVGFERAREAHEAFQRALRRRPIREQSTLRVEELRRLDLLARRIETNPNLTADALARKLRALDRLRDRLLAR